MSIAWWQPEGRLMHFPWLDRSGCTVPAYAVGWRIVDNPDEWTNRFLRFKSSRPGFFQAGAVLFREAVRELIAQKELATGNVGLATALSSGATDPLPNSPLFITGNWIAGQLGVQWVADVFEKDAHRPLKSLGAGADRDAEVTGKYRCAALHGVDHLIIMDDFITRGATLLDMHRAASTANPGLPISAIALGKNERSAWATSNGKQLDNAHIPQEWDDIWEQTKAAYP